MRKISLLVFGLVVVAASASCASEVPRDEALGSSTAALSASARHGQDVWFKATFGGERFFSVLLPGPPFNLRLGLDEVLTSDRSSRFDRYGVLNDPDCTQGDASTGFLDRCADPGSAGVVGIRRFPNPNPGGPPVLIGVACAACHAGLDPTRPPADPNHPTWANILPTIGNQYLDTGKIFAAHLSTHDPRWQVFRSWAPGTVDTTAIESDHINNPGVITPIFDLPDRPFFDFTDDGAPIHVHRAGQGGEDSVGCEKAALRVYFNIGMCAAECMIGHLANGPGGSQTPIDVAQCRRDCADFREAERDVVDLCAFLQTPRPPLLREAPGGDRFIDDSLVHRGKEVFERECAGCHSNGKRGPRDVLTDDEVHPASAIGTHPCRARSTNWQAGHIWAAFSSDEYKARGPGYYKDVSLVALWATAPFFHNNRLGAYSGDPSIAGRVAAYEDAMDKLLNPWRRDFLGSIQVTTDWITISGGLQLPAGTPVALFANLDPANPSRNLCPALVENAGHYYGAGLPPRDKRALTEFLKTR